MKAQYALNTILYFIFEIAIMKMDRKQIHDTKNTRERKENIKRHAIQKKTEKRNDENYNGL